MVGCCRSLLVRINGCFDRLIHLAVARAAAQVAAEGVANFVFARLGIFGKQMLNGYDEARCAISALKRPSLDDSTRAPGA